MALTSHSAPVAWREGGRGETFTLLTAASIFIGHTCLMMVGYSMGFFFPPLFLTNCPLSCTVNSPPTQSLWKETLQLHGCCSDSREKSKAAVCSHLIAMNLEQTPRVGAEEKSGNVSNNTEHHSLATLHILPPWSFSVTRTVDSPFLLQPVRIIGWWTGPLG